MLKPRNLQKKKKPNDLKKKRIKLNEKNSKHKEMLLPPLNKHLWTDKKKKRRKRQNKQKLKKKNKLPQQRKQKR
jgi:hypothetical protein